MGIAALAVAAIGSTYARFMQQNANLNVAVSETSVSETLKVDQVGLLRRQD